MHIRILCSDIERRPLPTGDRRLRQDNGVDPPSFTNCDREQTRKIATRGQDFSNPGAGSDGGERQRAQGDG